MTPNRFKKILSDAEKEVEKLPAWRKKQFEDYFTPRPIEKSMPLDNIQTNEDHIERVIDNFTTAYRRKYYKGAEEHGGRLWRKNTRAMLVDEVLDFVSYVDCIIEQDREAAKLLRTALDANDWGYVERALSVLEVGNADGVPEVDR